jgi:hypothetical protein
LPYFDRVTLFNYQNGLAKRKKRKQKIFYPKKDENIDGIFHLIFFPFFFSLCVSLSQVRRGLQGPALRKQGHLQFRK